MISGCPNLDEGSAVGTRGWRRSLRRESEFSAPLRLERERERVCVCEREKGGGAWNLGWARARARLVLVLLHPSILRWSQLRAACCYERGATRECPRRLYLIAEKAAPNPHLAYAEEYAALRIVPVTVPCSSCSGEHFLDRFDLNLLQRECPVFPEQ